MGEKDLFQFGTVVIIFFNEFNRYKPKSESGQVFTPDHITSLMYRVAGVGKNVTGVLVRLLRWKE